MSLLRSCTAGPNLLLFPDAGEVRIAGANSRPRGDEFARIDDRLIGRAQPVSAFAVHTGRPQPHPGCHDGLAWHDTRTNTIVQGRPDDLAVGEPVFAPDPRSNAPDRGWWITFTTRFSTGTSAMVVIPAADPAARPAAEIRMPVRVPLGLHGSRLPAS